MYVFERLVERFGRVWIKNYLCFRLSKFGGIEEGDCDE